MSASRAPRAAIWLLTHLTGEGRRDALIGDLVERFGRGRSRLWFWRQTLLAIAVSIVTDVRHHKWLAVRAVLSGILVASVLRFLLLPIAQSPVGSLVEMITGESRHIFFGAWAPLLTMVPAGWFVARFHREHAAAMVLTFALAILLANVPELERRIANALIDARYHPALRDFLSSQSLITCGILFGGSLSALSHRAVSGRVA